MAALYYKFNQSIAGYANAGQTVLLTETAALDQMVSNGYCTVVSGPAVNPNVVIGATLAQSQANAGMTERALRRFHQALADRNNNACDVMFAAGDSLVQSIGASTYAQSLPQRVLANLRAAFPQNAVGGIGMIESVSQGSLVANPWSDSPISGTVGGSLSPASSFTPGYGLGSGSVFLSASTQKRIFSFTGTDFDVQLFSQSTGGAGVVAITVDGTNYGTYNSGTGVLTAGAGNWTTTLNAGATTLAHVKIRGLTAAAHTVQLLWVSGVFYIGHGFAYNGDLTQGIRIASSGWSGRGTVNFVGPADGGAVATNPYAPGYQAEQWLQNIADGSYLPDLVFLSNYANDYAGTSHDVVTAAQNLANLTSLVAKIKAAVVTGAAAAGVASFIPSFVTIPPHCVVTSLIGGVSPSGGTMVDLWGSYAANAYNLAQNDPDGAVAVWDLGQRLQGSSNVFDNINYQGLLYTDNTHPNNAGNEWWARALVDFVRPK